MLESLGKKPTFTSNEIGDLKECVVLLGPFGFAPSIRDLRGLVQQYFTENNVEKALKVFNCKESKGKWNFAEANLGPTHVTSKMVFFVAVVSSWILVSGTAIQLRLHSCSAQVQALFRACQKFAMERNSDFGPIWK